MEMSLFAQFKYDIVFGRPDNVVRLLVLQFKYDIDGENVGNVSNWLLAQFKYDIVVFANEARDEIEQEKHDIVNNVFGIPFSTWSVLLLEQYNEVNEVKLQTYLKETTLCPFTFMT